MKSAWRTVKRKPEKLEIPRKTRGIFCCRIHSPARSGPPRWGKSPFFGTGPGRGRCPPGEHRDGLHALLAAGVQKSLQQLPGHALAAAAGADVQLRHLGGGPRVAGGALQQPAEEARRLPGHKGQQHPLGPGVGQSQSSLLGGGHPLPVKSTVHRKQDLPILREGRPHGNSPFHWDTSFPGAGQRPSAPDHLELHPVAVRVLYKAGVHGEAGVLRRRGDRLGAQRNRLPPPGLYLFPVLAV